MTEAIRKVLVDNGLIGHVHTIWTPAGTTSVWVRLMSSTHPETYKIIKYLLHAEVSLTGLHVVTPYRLLPKPVQATDVRKAA